MKRRLLLLILVLLGGLLAGDLLLTFVVLPSHWRPAPPFGAITKDTQRTWLEQQRLEIEADEEAGEEIGIGIGRFDARLGWSWRPNSGSFEGRYHFNSRGWRGVGEYSAEAAPGIHRIVACGDSFTFCQDVADAEAWPALLDAGWSEAEVINLGVGGYGTDQALLRFRGEDLGERVDVVLIGMLLENIGRNVNRYRPLWYPLTDTAAVKPRFVEEGGELRLIEQPFATRRELVEAVESGAVIELLGEHEYWSDPHVPSLLRWSGFARLFGMRAASVARQPSRLWSRPDEEPFRTSLAILRTFRDEAFVRGARVAPVLLFPSEADLLGVFGGEAPYWTHLTDALDAAGVEYVDLSAPLLEAFCELQEGDPPLYVGGHLGPEGNAVVALTVRHWLAPHFEK
jgi:hypothetical protein